MKIELKGKALPRNDKGDVAFARLGLEHVTNEQLVDAKDMSMIDSLETVLEVFTEAEIVELVNRALYQMEYQKESHKKRGALERAKMKAIKEEMKKAGIKPLKGE